jgi:hypothetical protein
VARTPDPSQPGRWLLRAGAVIVLDSEPKVSIVLSILALYPLAVCEYCGMVTFTRVGVLGVRDPRRPAGAGGMIAVNGVTEPLRSSKVVNGLFPPWILVTLSAASSF